MKQIFRKLRDEGGMSILIAMILLLVVSMVSVTVVTAAATSAQRSHANYEANRTNAALESAARFIRAELDGASVTVTDKKQGSESGSSVSGFPKDPVYKNSKGNVVTNLPFAAEMNQIRQSIAGTGGESGGSFTISASPEDFPEIEAAYRIDGKDDSGLYPVTITLTAKESGESMRLYFNVDWNHEATPKKQGRTTYYDIVDTFTWKAPTHYAERGGAA